MYRIWTVEDGRVEPGASIELVELGLITLKAVTVGQEGRGRHLGILPIVGAAEALEIDFGSLDFSGSRPKLKFETKSDTADAAIVVLKTGMGYQGGNSHSGEEVGSEMPVKKIICCGQIAQGAAGSMGSGLQYIVLMPKDAIIRIERIGRLYGEPGVHFLNFDGERLIALTPEARELTDAF